jgi:hypothetical protein
MEPAYNDNLSENITSGRVIARGNEPSIVILDYSKTAPDSTIENLINENKIEEALNSYSLEYCLRET